MRYQSFFFLLLSGCATITWEQPTNWKFMPISTDNYKIATWGNISDTTSPIHIYIEGDGHSFTKRGYPSSDPTPQNTTLRDIAAMDTSPNVIYMARPCMYIKTDNCNIHDWTDGRFSPEIISAMTQAIKNISGKRPIILIGYSGGAMISGLIIKQNPKMNIEQWITIAGVLNHSDWTQYFHDKPLSQSLDMTTLPDIKQQHYVASSDKVVPISLSKKWTNNTNLIVVPNSTHSQFDKIILDFSNQ